MLLTSSVSQSVHVMISCFENINPLIYEACFNVTTLQVSHKLHSFLDISLVSVLADIFVIDRLNYNILEAFANVFVILLLL